MSGHQARNRRRHSDVDGGTEGMPAGAFAMFLALVPVFAVATLMEGTARNE